MLQGGQIRKLGKEGKEKVKPESGWFVSCIFEDGDLNLEENLINLAQYKNTCTIGIFECCRTAKFRTKGTPPKGSIQLIFGCEEG
jgi:hypothetical protein